jgi:hypothetical protein
VCMCICEVHESKTFKAKEFGEFILKAIFAQYLLLYKQQWKENNSHIS